MARAFSFPVRRAPRRRQPSPLLSSELDLGDSASGGVAQAYSPAAVSSSDGLTPSPLARRTKVPKVMFFSPRSIAL